MNGYHIFITCLNCQATILKDNETVFRHIEYDLPKCHCWTEEKERETK